MWGYGMGYGMGWWMWALMALGTIGFTVVVAYVVLAVIQGGPTPPAAPTTMDPLRLLDERLARGEIDAEEYQRTRNVLTGAH